MLPVKWYQVLLCITNNSIKHQAFVYTQLNDQTVLFQTIQFSICYLSIFSLKVKYLHLTQNRGPYQVLSLRFTVDLGAIAMKRYTTFPQITALLEPRYQIFVSYLGHSLGCLIPLQRCIRCILQPQPTGLQRSFVLLFPWKSNKHEHVECEYAKMFLLINTDNLYLWKPLWKFTAIFLKCLCYCKKKKWIISIPFLIDADILSFLKISLKQKRKFPNRYCHNLLQ